MGGVLAIRHRDGQPMTTTYYLNSPRGTRESIRTWAAAIGAEVASCVLCLDGTYQAMARITREVAQEILTQQQEGPSIYASIHDAIECHLPALRNGCDGHQDAGAGCGGVLLHDGGGDAPGQRT